MPMSSSQVGYGPSRKYTARNDPRYHAKANVKLGIERDGSSVRRATEQVERWVPFTVWFLDENVDGGQV